jgi:ABC-type transporter Mla maintaining outer membrane lipid asymmetry ATPase subunit MlaF
VSGSQAPTLLSISDVEKDYHSLRPLRLRRLDLREGDAVALLGFDRAGAEVLVNLIAGATLPDRGEVVVLGRSTAAITDGDAWMQALDDVGILSERAILLDQMTTEQNLAVPLSLELHALPEAVRARVVALASEVGLAAEALPRFLSELSPVDRMRVRLARALAGEPRLLLAEHPNASLDPAARPLFAAVLKDVAAARRLALLVLTADRAFAASATTDVRSVSLATGELTRLSRGWGGWFR